MSDDIGSKETDDPWAWAHETRPSSRPNVDASHVLAVLVAHNGEAWLPATLEGLAELDPRPGYIVAVDAESKDDSHVLLDEAATAGIVDRVVTGVGADGFGANVQRGIQDLSDADRAQYEWLWLLHDDAAPTPRALGELLKAASSGDDRGPDVLVPKLLHPKLRNHPDQLSAVGESISAAGDRVLSVEPGDIDQKQQDARRVLGGSTAGMLISRDAWTTLGGLDPAVPLFRDGVDFGWRANQAGFIVKTCPQAAFHHAEAGRVGLRDSLIAPDSLVADRVAGMTVAAAHADKPGAAARRLSSGTFGRAIGFVLGKSPANAKAMMAARKQFSQQRAGVDSLAATVAKTSTEPTDPILIPHKNWGARHRFDRFAGRIADRYREFTAEDETGGMIDELTGNDFAGRGRRGRLFSPILVGAVVMLVLSLVASRRQFAAGKLIGPALLPAPDHLGQAWSAWLTSAPGLPGSNAPWLGFAALGSTLTFGHPDWFATLMVLGGSALAAWTAHHFFWQIVGRNWLAAALAMLWGVLLPVVGATGRGDLDATVVAIILPLLGSTMLQWLSGQTKGSEGWRRPASAALLITILASGVPILYLVGLAAVVTVAISRRDLRGGLVAALGPVIVLAPWFPRLAVDPGRLLTGTDPGANWAGDAPAAMSIFLGRGAATQTPLIISVLMVVALWLLGLAGAAMARTVDRGSRILLLVGSVVAPFIGVALSRFVVTVNGVPARPDPTVWSLLGFFALIVLAAHGIGLPPERDVDDTANQHRWFVSERRLREQCGWLVFLVALVGAAWWVVGAADPLSRQQSPLPTYVEGIQDSNRQTRTLMVDLTQDAARFSVASANHPTWGDGERTLLSDPGMSDQVREITQQIAQGAPSDELTQQLMDMGIGHIWLRGASQDVAFALNTAPQLSSARADSNTMVYTVEGQPSWLTLVRNGTSEPVTTDDAAKLMPGDTLIVSQPADASWRASLDGHELPTTDSGDWRQAWQVNTSGDNLKVSMRSSVWTALWSLLTLAVLVVLAAPAVTDRPQTPKRALAGSAGTAKKRSWRPGRGNA